MPVHRCVLAMFVCAVGYSSAESWAQAPVDRIPSPYLPGPLPPAGMYLPPAPVLVDPAMPRLNPEPSPVLAVLAAQSNEWVPACDPPGPTKGLWGEHGPPGPRTWQEYYMTGRDCLTWMFTSPICTCGAQAPPESSAWNWMTQWLPTWGNGHSSPPCPPRDQHPGMRILAGGPPGYVAPTPPWAWLVQWLPTNSLPVRMLGGS